MKLPWFCHSNNGQLLCNCLRFRPLFWRETNRDMLSFCCCLKMAENSVSWLCRTKILQLQHKHRIIKCLAVQRLNNNELEEQCIHHFNLIKYLIEGKSSTEWEKVRRSCLYPIRPESRFMQKIINKELHVVFGKFGI